MVIQSILSEDLSLLLVLTDEILILPNKISESIQTIDRTKSKLIIYLQRTVHPVCV